MREVGGTSVVNTRAATIHSGVLAGAVGSVGYREYDLGSKEAPHSTTLSETQGRLMRTKVHTSGVSSNGNQQKPSAFRRFASRITGVPLSPDEDELVELARKAHERSERLVRSRGNVMEDVMFPK